MQTRWRARSLVHTLVVLSLLVLGPAGPSQRSAEAQGLGISYVYDPFGRLTGVLDGLGSIAKYVYDPVGNLTAILRESSTPVLITGFSPASGTPGTTVTITGVGFSTTGTNTVQFGAGATTSATATSSTQLTVTVPTGALTGSLKVTTPTDSGGANSAAVFTTFPDSRAPRSAMCPRREGMLSMA